jgi:hypothetical protein
MFSGKPLVDDERCVSVSQTGIGLASVDRKEESSDGKKEHDRLEYITIELQVEAAKRICATFLGEDASSAFIPFHGVLSGKWLLGLL